MFVYSSTALIQQICILNFVQILQDWIRAKSSGNMDQERVFAIQSTQWRVVHRFEDHLTTRVDAHRQGWKYLFCESEGWIFVSAYRFASLSGKKIIVLSERRAF